jgi:hypothetical protein
MEYNTMTMTIERYHLDGQDHSEDAIPSDCPDCRRKLGYLTERDYAPEQPYYCAGCQTEWWVPVDRRWPSRPWKEVVHDALFISLWATGMFAITALYVLVYIAIVIQGGYTYWTGMGIALAIAFCCLMTWILWGQLLVFIDYLIGRAVRYISGSSSNTTTD